MRIVSGILVGTLLGLASGVLMAPEKGTKTRKKFAKNSNKFSKEAENSLDEVLTKLIDALNQSLGKKKKKKSIFNF